MFAHLCRNDVIIIKDLQTGQPLSMFHVLHNHSKSTVGTRKSLCRKMAILTELFFLVGFFAMKWLTYIGIKLTTKDPAGVAIWKQRVDALASVAIALALMVWVLGRVRSKGRTAMWQKLERYRRKPPPWNIQTQPTEASEEHPSHCAEYRTDLPSNTSTEDLQQDSQPAGTGSTLKVVNQLPDELLLKIFKHLPHDETVVSVRAACSHFKQLINDGAVWRNHTLRVHGQLKPRLLKHCIRRCSAITTLDLTNCIQVSDPMVYHLVTRWPMMKHIHLTGCVLLTNKSLFTLRECLTALVSLSISQCQLPTCYGLLEVLKKHCTTMQYLDISNCVGLLRDRFHISDIARYSNNLVQLNVEWSAGCETALLLDSDLSHIASSSPNLRVMNITCSPTHGDSFQAISTSCKKLEQLIAKRCFIVPSELEFLSKNLAELRHLDLAGCNMREIAYQAIYKNAKQLAHLNLSYCASLTSGECRQLFIHLKLLKELLIKDCHQVDDNAVAEAATHQMICFLDISGTMVTSDQLRELYSSKHRMGGNCAFMVKAEGCPFIATRYSQPWKPI